MENHDHIVLQRNSYKSEEYKGKGFGDSTIPQRDAEAHAALLSELYTQAKEAYEKAISSLPENVSAANGVYMKMTVDTAAKALDSLNTSRGAKLMNFQNTENADLNIDATLFIPNSNRTWFQSKISQYLEKPIEENKRKNEALVNSIDTISAVDLSSFFVNKDDYEFTTNNTSVEYEMWIDSDDANQEEIDAKLDSIGVTYGNRVLVFDSVIVFLIKATKDQLLQIIASIDFISEFRKYHRPSVLIGCSSRSDEEDYNTLIHETIPVADGQLSRIGVLDTGVNNAHPLISPFLSNERCLSAIVSGNTRDTKNHGTAMASLSLYGDFTDVIYNPHPDPVESDLVSVRILPDDDDGQYTNEMYAVITEDGISQARDNNYSQVLCSAVTSKKECTDSTASATSAAIDQTLYNNGKADSMLLISAGNTVDTQNLPYPDYLYLSNILDPAQSWNALTVGAYTKKVLISDPEYKNAKIVAPEGGLCPYTSTSKQWGQTIIKPEILMEGGNAILENGSLSDHEDIMPIGADSHPDIHKFMGFNATSSATALAAHLAGQIKYKYPTLSPLAIRALMVHSAEWTPEMFNLSTENGELNKYLLLHTCGYGVPNPNKAKLSSDSYVTFIAEDDIQPLTLSENASVPNFSKLNIYKLPWPDTILQEMKDINVKLKITLSYYIDPCPGAKGRLTKYSYQSIRLYFDVNQPEETYGMFKRRVSRLGEEDPIDNDTTRWYIGIQRRNQGSIISDSIEKTASEMAACKYISIYPSGGWYKYRKSKVDAVIKYALIVSLETPEQDIYTEIAQKVGIVNTLEIDTEM